MAVCSHAWDQEKHWVLRMVGVGQGRKEGAGLPERLGDLVFATMHMSARACMCVGLPTTAWRPSPSANV